MMKINDFAARRNGNVALTSALTVSVLAAASLGVVESSNAYRVKRETQAALDSAVLAATQVAGSGDVQAVGQARFEQALELRELDIAPTDVQFVYDQNSNTVRGTAQYELDSVVGEIFGISDKNMSVDAAAEPQIITQVEIALALDTSGSMDYYMDSNTVAPDGESRMDAMLDALRLVVDTTIGERDDGGVYMSLIPFAGAVNVTSYYNTLPSSYFDEEPELSTYASILTHANGGTYSTAAGDRVWAEERPERVHDGHIHFDLQPPEAHPLNVFGVMDRAYEVSDVDVLPHSSWITPAEEVLGLTNSKAEIDAALDTFGPYGGTAGHLGMEWALYALAPEWQTFWGLDAPAGDFNVGAEDDDVRKVIVMLTDGTFSTVQSEELNPYWYPWHYTAGRAQANVNWAYKYFQTVCEEAVDNGVKVFTIAVAFSEEQGQPAVNSDGEPYTRYSNGTPLGELQRCPGDPKDHSNFFLVNDAAQMQAAFAAIIANIGELRLTE